MVFGVDFGLSVTDAVALDEVAAAPEGIVHAALSRPGPASVEVLERALALLAVPGPLRGPVGVTGGLSRELPPAHGRLDLVQVPEPEAVARGALALARLERGLVVSCGTGTAMILADLPRGAFEHVTGTPVGGGTLEAFGRLLLDGRSATEVAELALEGEAARVDTTLADVLGGSLGSLPPTATAVSLGRVALLDAAPAPADLAAGLSVMVAQTIALLAVSAAKGQGEPAVVFVGRVSRYPVIAAMIRAVFAVYRYASKPHFPARAEQATALGAALAARAASSGAAPGSVTSAL